MPAYYNEIDGKKAAWLRELIKRNLIAPGDVDERSIVDVRPDDLRGFTQCHFFAGIGIWSHALRLAGWADDREVWTGSCPCQPFSAAGKGEAFDDERHLWPEFFRLIHARRPIVCFGEQVASIDGLTWLDLVQSDLDDADYTCGALDLCAAGVGAPHIRQRLYWVAHTGDISGMEDTNGLYAEQSAGSGAGAINQGSWWPRGESSGSGEACRLANTECSERRPTEQDGTREASGRLEGTSESRERSETERVDNADDGERFRRQQSQGGRSESQQRCTPIGMADTTGAGLEGSRGTIIQGRYDGPQYAGGGGGGGVSGPVNGFWRSADWVLTRPQRMGDRPGLRPVERGAFPLAHGSPARVGRLRGYGDGIVAEVAKAFIEAYLKLREN